MQGSYLWMVLPYVPGGSVQSAMDYAFPKVKTPALALSCMWSLIGGMGA